MTQRLLEIACFNLGSALIAEANGADRIELCANYWEGGTTPLQRHIAEARERIKIPMHVIIRARGGDYVYSDSELKEMKEAIIFCKENKVDGIVIGILTENFEVDKETCAELIQLAKPMSVTFHRAIDHCYNLTKSFEDLISLGIERVLTSGGKENVLQGVSQLKRLQEEFSNKITIIAGGGLRATNIQQVIQTGCLEYHSAALTDNTVTANAAEIKKLKRFL